MKIIDYLEKNLAVPDGARRSVQIIHSGFPQTPETVESYLDTAEKNGLGGFCVNMDYNRCPNEGTPEADAAWGELRYFIEACLRRGFKVWIYDEKAYPSGAANDLVLRTDPDYQVKGLICRTVVTDGGMGTAEGDTGTVKYAAAYPMDENGILLREEEYPVTVSPTDGSISWNLPEGRYRIGVFYTRPVNFYTENKVPYVDLMRADVVDRFIEVTHEAYRRHLGDETIAKITAFFTDEPGLPVHGCSSYFPEKNAVAAWTEAMDDLLPADMPAHYVSLFFDTGDSADDAFRRRIYWQTAADLFGKNYFARIAAWCKKYNTRMTGHLYGEETLSMQIGLNADLFGLMRHMQAPGVDRLYCTDPRDVTAEKTASSAAHLYGRNMVMSENSFHLEHNFWHTPEAVNAENRLNSAYYQIQLGLTNIASYYGYSPAPDPERKTFEERTARASGFCSMGRHETDVLVLIPMTGAYERFTMPDHKYWNVGPCTAAPHQPEPVQKLEQSYGAVLEQLEDCRFDFDLIDETGLAEDVTADHGTLRTPYETFRNLVLFDSGLICPAAQETIRAYLDGGGHVTVVNSDLSTDFCREIEEVYPTLVARCGYGDIAKAITARPVLRIEESCPLVRVRKSHIGDAELWFIHNRGGSEAEFTVKEAGEFTVYTAEMEKSVLSSDGAFPLKIPAHDIRMLVREKTVEPQPGADFTLCCAGDTVKILQLTDPQITDLSQARNQIRLNQLTGAFFREGIFDDDLRTYEPIRRMVKAEKPDLIILTGDLIYGETDDGGTLWLRFIEFMDSLETPWAFAWGNHDNESAMGVSWQTEQVKRSEYCLFKRGSVTGNSNYSIAVDKNGVTEALLMLLDTNGCHIIGDAWAPGEGMAELNADEPLLTHENGIYPDQVEWYRRTAEAVSAGAGRRIPSFAFFHIPPSQLDRACSEIYCYDRKPFTVEESAYRREGDFGEMHEPGWDGYVDRNGTFWHTAKEAGTVGMFFGHEHNNNLSILYDGIRLTFGLKTGSHCHHLNHLLGGTVIEIKENGSFHVRHIYEQ